MANYEIRDSARKNKVPLWRIAMELGISEPTITRHLRTELPPEKQEQILSIIDRLAESKREEAVQ